MERQNFGGAARMNEVSILTNMVSPRKGENCTRICKVLSSSVLAYMPGSGTTAQANFATAEDAIDFCQMFDKVFRPNTFGLQKMSVNKHTQNHSHQILPAHQSNNFSKSANLNPRKFVQHLSAYFLVCHGKDITIITSCYYGY